MDDEVINFPVPKRFLSVVIQALASAMNNEGKALQVAVEVKEEQGEGTEGEAASKSPIDWTVVENAKRLKHGVASLQIAKSLLNMTADRAGEWVPFTEICADAGFSTSKSAKSSLGSLTKVIKRDFKVEYDDAIWPVSRYWSLNGDSQFYYKMSPEVAEVWKAA